MKIRSIMYKIDVALVGLIMGLTWAPAVASADGTPPSNTNPTSSPTNTAPSTNDSTQIQNIISRGNQEIQRRMNNLDKLESLINTSDKLSETEKNSLIGEITSASQGLATLLTQLDNATTLTEAKTDAQNIVTEYRIYVLVDPKIHLLKVADDQQVIEAKLSSLAQKLQTRINTAQSNNQNVSNLSSLLSSMNSSINAAQTISSSIESSVSGLQPTDYNSNHSVLEGDNTQLQTARSDIQSAYNDAKQIIAGLEALNSSSSSSSSSTNTTH